MSIGSTLLEYLNNQSKLIGMPVVDESLIKFNIDLDLMTGFRTLSQFNSELVKYGLVLVHGRRSLPMLVIEDEMSGDK